MVPLAEMLKNVSLAPAFSAMRVWTRLILVVCVVLELFMLIWPQTLWSMCIDPGYIMGTSFGAIYTVFTSPFAHVSLLHFLFNMLAWVQLGNTFENSVGTARFAVLFWIALTLIGFVMIILSQFWAFTFGLIFGNSGSCHAGLSGILFCLLVLDTKASPHIKERSVLGIFNVPSSRYPAVLLVVLQLIIPSVSFIGHLSGLIVGYWLLSYYDRVQLGQPYLGKLDRLGEQQLGKFNYLAAPSTSSLPSYNDTATSTGSGDENIFTKWAEMTKNLVQQQQQSQSGGGNSSIEMNDIPVSTNANKFPGSGQVLGGNSSDQQ